MFDLMIYLYDHSDTRTLFIIHSANNYQTFILHNPFRTKAPKYLFPRGNKPLL